MGTINYFTSDFITLGYNTNCIDYNEEFYNDDIQWEFDEIEKLIKEQCFYYFNISLKPGYYEGFSIDIEYNFSYSLDDYNDKLQALKEITRIKKFLVYVVNNFEVCVVHPGWCTAYLNFKDSLSEINNAIKEMRTEVKQTPTYYQLYLAGEY